MIFHLYYKIKNFLKFIRSLNMLSYKVSTNSSKNTNNIFSTKNYQISINNCNDYGLSILINVNRTSTILNKSIKNKIFKRNIMSTASLLAKQYAHHSHTVVNLLDKHIIVPKRFMQKSGKKVMEEITSDPFSELTFK